MRYTVQSGLEPGLFGRLGDNTPYVTSLVVVLIASSLLALSRDTHLHKAQNPPNLSIYTIKTAGGASRPGGRSSSASNGKSPSGGPSTAAPVSSSGVSGGMPITISGSPIGGQGGGDLTGSSGSNPQGGGVSTTLQTPGVSIGPASVGGTSETIDPGLPKPGL